MKTETVSIRVAPGDVGLRFDTFVAQRLPDFSRSSISDAIRDGIVRVDGRIKKPGYRLKHQDHVSGSIPLSAPSICKPEPIALEIVHEDDYLTAINKPPGMVVHPAPGHLSGTLVNAILHRYPELQPRPDEPDDPDETRPGIVHRLDKDTSGLLLIARTADTRERLIRMFKERAVDKTYLTLVYGNPKTDAGEIDAAIGRHPVRRKRMAVHAPNGKPALTGWRVSRRFDGAALLAVDLKTGRTHQIRVHMEAIGHPVVGDPVYVGGMKNLKNQLRAETTRLLDQCRRQMLHAWKIGFRHPMTDRDIRLEAPLPEDMRLVLDQMENDMPAIGHRGC